MSDSDLANLLEEVDFSSPQRNADEDYVPSPDSQEATKLDKADKMSIKPLQTKKKVDLSKAT